MPTPPSRGFSPMKAMGIPPRDYQDFWKEEPKPFKTNPDRGYSATGSMLTPVDAYADQFGAFQRKQELDALNARKEVLSEAEDLLSPAARQKRLGYMLRGGLQPQEELVIERGEPKPIRPPVVNKYSPVPTEVVKASTALDYINPTDEDAWEKRVKILQDLDSDPDYGFSNVKAHPFFREKDQALMRDILAARSHREVTGRAEAAKSKLSALEARQLELAAQEIPMISDARRVAAFRSANGRDPVNAQELAMADQILEKELSPRRQALAAIVRDLEAEGRSVPGRYKEMAGAVQQNVPHGTLPPQPQAPPDEIPTVSSPSELRSLNLPSGSKFKTPDGKIGTVK